MTHLLKIFLLLVVFSIISLNRPQKTFALYQNTVKAIQEGNNFEWYNNIMMGATTDNLLIFIAGARNDQGEIIQTGAIQTTESLIAATYNKPASSVDYVAYLLNNAGLTKTAYAQQGQGWDFLSSAKSTSSTNVVLDLWRLIRNVAYIFFIVIFVVIGFMIMFRSKLNPQTVVNIQLALPGIIMSLILVTFSFAICGLIIDLVYLGHGLIAMIFFGPGGTSPLYDILQATGGGTSGAYLDVMEKIDIITALLAPNSTGGAGGLLGINVFSQLGDFIINITDTIKDIVTGTNVAGLIPLILAFTLLGTGLKIFFGLLTKYVTLILMTIFSPLMFLFSAFPGRGEGIGSFLRTMASAALTFPATGFMFFLAGFFMSKTTGIDLHGLPPLNETGVLTPGGASAPGSPGSTNLINVLEPLVGLGILMAATQVPQAIDQAMGAKPGIAGAATPDIGSALSKIPIIGSLIH